MHSGRLVSGLGLSIGMMFLLAATTATAGPKVVVNPGESIQDAVDSASPGTTILVMPGIYQENHAGPNAVTITKDGIRLIARVRTRKGEKVILQPYPGSGQMNGILVQGTAEAYVQRSMIKGFTVQGFPNNGIVTEYVDHFRIEKNESIDNLENGINPTLSAHGLVKRNLSYGSKDSALWVETSVKVRVLHNTVHSSPTGIEISNSEDIVVRKNDVYGNATGIGLYYLPNMETKVVSGWKVMNNYVHDNNGPNEAPPGDMAAGLPPGGGILILGADDSVVKHNRVEDNGFYGIALVDYCMAMSGSSFDCAVNPPDIDPAPDDNLILGNTVTNNGVTPPDHPLAPLAADIISFIGQNSTGNCFQGNTYSTSFPPTLPGC